MAKSAKYKLFNSKFTAVVSVALVLVLLGLTTMVLLTSRNLTNHVRENFIFKVALKDGPSEAQIQKIGADLKNKPYVNDVTFVSKEQAVADLSEMLGDDPMEWLNVNPLPNSFDITLKADKLEDDSLKVIEADLKKIPEVSEINFPNEVVDAFSSNVHKVTAVLLLFVVALLLISFALINNTMRLLIYSDRFLIYTMQQVGATKGFIRKPYLKQGFFIGLVSSIIAVVVLYAMLFCMGALSENLDLYLDIHNVSLCLVTFGVVLAAGIIITEISTFFAVNRYLSRSLNSLYQI